MDGPTGCRWWQRLLGPGCCRSRRCRGRRRGRTTTPRGCSSSAEVAAPAVAGVPRGARRAAGHGVDVASGHGDAPLGVGGGGDFLDPVVARVGNVEVAGGVERDAVGLARAAPRWPVRRRRDAGGPAGAGHGVDVAGGHGLPPLGAGGGGHFLDPVVAGVGDEEVARCVDCDLLGPSRSAGRLARPADSRLPELPPAMV